MFNKFIKIFKKENQFDELVNKSNPYGRIPDDFKEGYCKFKGFLSKPSVCYIKLHIENDKKIIFCCQLPNYTRTSITNDIESIVSRFSNSSNNLTVVEHYAPGLSINPKGTYAIIKFNEDLTSPEWHFYSKEKIIECAEKNFSHIPPNFFDMPLHLENWQNEENHWY